MSKYNNIRTTVDGIKFDSKAEAKRYGQLKILEKSGDISQLELQPVYKIVINGAPVRFAGSNRPMKYVADFRYRTKSGETETEDVKGVLTAVYKMKKALVEHIYPGTKILEIK